MTRLTADLAAPTSLALAVPNGGETWAIGSVSQGNPVDLQRSRRGNVKIEVSRNGGTSWAIVNGNVANSGTFNWTVTGPATTQARIRITSLTDQAVADTSDANLTLGGGSLAVTAPNGGQRLPDW